MKCTIDVRFIYSAITERYALTFMFIIIFLGACVYDWTIKWLKKILGKKCTEEKFHGKKISSFPMIIIPTFFYKK